MHKATFLLILPIMLLAATAVAEPVFCQKGRKIRLRDGFCKGKERQIAPPAADAPSVNGLSAQEIVERAVAAVGRDAQSLGGLTVDQIVDQAVARTTAILGTLLAETLLVTTPKTDTVMVAEGFCGCATVTCGSGNFLVDCGATMPRDGTGYLTEAFGDTIPNPSVCSACGCAVGALPTSVTATATCLSL